MNHAFKRKLLFPFIRQAFSVAADIGRVKLLIWLTALSTGPCADVSYIERSLHFQYGVLSGLSTALEASSCLANKMPGSASFLMGQ